MGELKGFKEGEGERKGCVEKERIWKNLEIEKFLSVNTNSQQLPERQREIHGF